MKLKIMFTQQPGNRIVTGSVVSDIRFSDGWADFSIDEGGPFCVRVENIRKIFFSEYP